MEQSALGMTRGQSVAGCLVLLTTVLCGAASAPWAEQRFSGCPSPPRPRTRASV